MREVRNRSALEIWEASLAWWLLSWELEAENKVPCEESGNTWVATCQRCRGPVGPPNREAKWQECGERGRMVRGEAEV